MPATSPDGGQIARSRAVDELLRVVTQSRMWRALAYADIRSRYRRTTLGPFWITLTTGTMALGVGVIYGQFFGQKMTVYLPYLTSGLILWSFIASAAGEGSTVLIGNSSLIKSSTFPLAFHVMRMMQRNLIVFLHNILILAAMWLILRWSITPSIFSAILGVALLYVFLAGVALSISIMCVRYRDVPQIVQAATQFLFFASPIIWYPESLRFGHVILLVNPITYFLAVTRNPLLNRPTSWEDWAAAAIFTAASILIAAFVYVRYRDRVAYWI